jgi:diacylglycerol kinase (ATP)
VKNKTLLDAFKNSKNGLKELFREKAANREAWLVLLSIITVYLYPNFYSLLLFVISILLLSFEAINTSIEKLCDHITPTINDEIKKIKDLAAAAILLLVMLYLIIFILAIRKFFS